tara:strand:- start:10501 stop:10980 length:480 start_codon:yes stop_codon:yes gene_type:complete
MATIYEDEINELKNELIIAKGRKYCYSCCKYAFEGVCLGCGSDDLMTELAGVGRDWHFSISDLIDGYDMDVSEVTFDEFREEFLLSLDESYPPTEFMGLFIDASYMWEEHINDDSEIHAMIDGYYTDGTIVEINSKWYRTDDLITALKNEIASAELQTA